MPRYSVVISPPEEILEEVAGMKQKLKDSIGFYHSCNSLAHITFNLFEGNEQTLEKWERYLDYFTLNNCSISVHFDKTGYFSNGAFFLAPDDESKAKLVQMMKAFHRGFPAVAFGKSKEPHISIGRQLNEDQLATATELLHTVAMSFSIDDLVIRKFNEARKQYDIYRRFNFRGEAPASLF